MDTYLHLRNLYGALITVYGDGRIKLESMETTASLNLALYDEKNFQATVKNALIHRRGRRWSPSVEFTVYFTKKSHNPTQGIKGSCLEIHLTSDHHFGTSACPYNAHEYILNIMNNGEVYFTGEPYHTTRRDPKPDGIIDVDFWGTNHEGIPLDVEIGIKFVKRVSGNGKNVLLEAYRDMTNGANGGTWQKLFEFEHEEGNWDNEELEQQFNLSILNNQECVIVPTSADMPHAHDGGMCYLRMSSVKEIELRWLSCRDILPIFYPSTTTAELTASGDSGETESGL
jgi:hypothetical protein